MRVFTLLGLLALMRSFEASGIAPVFASLAQLAQVASTDRKNEKVAPDMRLRATEILGSAWVVCKDMELAESRGMIERLQEQFGIGDLRSAEIQHSFHDLTRLMESEMDKRLFLIVQPDAARFYEQDALFGPEVRKAFPDARDDIREAGSCYATGAATATVYHCMCALEAPLRWMAKELGVPFGDDGWQVVISKIESEIHKLGPTLPRGSAKSQRLQFLGEAAKEFIYFKDGWRNYVAHAKVSYDRDQALSVLNHTGAFMRTLAKELAEP